MAPVTEARTTTIIRKPPGRKASDAGRSRLGDYTRPIAREQRVAPNRRPAVLFGLVATIVAISIGAALFGLPVRTWFDQDRKLEQLQHELSEMEQVNGAVQADVDRLQTDAGIMEAAREELGMVPAGESQLTMNGLPPLPTDLPDGWPYTAAEQIMVVRAAGG